jgi:hypothetical protein
MCLTMGACYLHFRRSVCGTIVVKFAGFGKPVGFRGPAGFGAGGRSSPVTGFGSGSGSVVGSRVRVHGLSTRPESDPLPRRHHDPDPLLVTLRNMSLMFLDPTSVFGFFAGLPLLDLEPPFAVLLCMVILQVVRGYMGTKIS